MIRNLAVACVATLGLAIPTLAATYSFSASTTSVSLVPGETVTIGLFVTETTDGIESSLFADELGLLSAEVRVQQVSTTAASATTVLDVADVTINPQFDDTFLNDTAIVGTTVDIAGFADLLGVSGPTGTVEGNTTSIKIADVTFTAGSEGVTVVELIDNPIPDNTLTFLNFEVLDSLLPTAGNGPIITFTVIPEPGILGLLASLSLMARRRRA
jgi:hypothetical protein